jgi:hypothetical protein
MSETKRYVCDVRPVPDTGTGAGQAMWVVFRMDMWAQAEAFRRLATSTRKVAEPGTASNAT